MSISLLHKSELGDGLEFENGKLKVKVGSGNEVNLSVDYSGLKADLDLSNNSEITSLKQKVTEAESALQRKVESDTKPTSIAFGNNALTIQLSDNTSVQTDFTQHLIFPLINNAEEIYLQTLAEKLVPLILKQIKGEEVRDFNGETKGYLLNNA